MIILGCWDHGGFYFPPFTCLFKKKNSRVNIQSFRIVKICCFIRGRDLSLRDFTAQILHGDLLDTLRSHTKYSDPLNLGGKPNSQNKAEEGFHGAKRSTAHVPIPGFTHVCSSNWDYKASRRSKHPHRCRITEKYQGHELSQQPVDSNSFTLQPHFYNCRYLICSRFFKILNQMKNPPPSDPTGEAS